MIIHLSLGTFREVEEKLDDIDVLAQMEQNLYPKNMSEFQMGLHLAELIDAVTTGKVCNLNALIEGANESMNYWFDKYEEDLAAMDGESS